MKTKMLLIIILIFLSVSGGSASSSAITGTVVDADTGTPIEGAVVLVEWTKGEGYPGLSYTKSYKVVEAVTDKDGKFTVEDVKKILIDPPDVTVYKKGYVAWNNKLIFPDYKKRTDFKWQDGSIFKLESFKSTYSYVDHESFIESAAHTFIATEKKNLFLKTYDDWERAQVIKENRANDKAKGMKIK